MRKAGVGWLSALILFCGALFSVEKMVQAAAQPDLSVEMKLAEMKDKNVVGGEIGNFVRIRVSNIGSAAASAYKVIVVLSTNSAIVIDPSPNAPMATGRIIGQRNMAHLPAGASEVLTISPLNIPGDISWGEYFITAVVDPFNMIVESNETNNRVQRHLFVMADASLIEQYYSSAGVFVGFIGKGFGNWKSSVSARVGSYTIATLAQNWTNTSVRAFPAPQLIPVGTQSYEASLYDGSKRICPIRKISWGIFFASANPSSGPAGTQVMLGCYNCQAQGTKKLVLHDQNYQFVAEVPIVFWNNGQVVGTIPNVPPGSYFYMVTDGGELITHEWKVTFKVI